MLGRGRRGKGEHGATNATMMRRRRRARGVLGVSSCTQDCCCCRQCDFVHKATPLKLHLARACRTFRIARRTEHRTDQNVEQIDTIISAIVLNAVGDVWRGWEDIVLVPIWEQVHQDMLHADARGAGEERARDHSGASPQEQAGHQGHHRHPVQ